MNIYLYTNYTLDMKYKTLTILESDYLKLKNISDRRGVTLMKLYSILTAYLEKNETIFFPELFEDNSKIENDEIEVPISKKEIQKLLTKDVNRVIGFIKKQDEILLDIRQLINDKIKQVLFKLIPEEEREYMEYHPLFNDYDNIINILKKYINKKNSKIENLEEDIKKELGENVFEEYIKYSNNIVKKNFLE